MEQMTVFQYRVHLQKMKRVYPIFIVVAVIVLIAGIVLSDTFLIIMSIVLGIEFVFGYNLFSRMVSSSLGINDEGVYYKNNKTDLFIGYEEIQKIDTRSISFLGGYFMIVKDKKTKIRVAVTLESIGMFVILLKKHLTEKGLEHLYNEDKLFKFFKTAVYADGSWRRFYHVFPRIIYYTVAFFVYVTALTVFSIYQESLVGAVGLFLMSGALMLGFVVYLIDEIVNYSKVVKHKTNAVTWNIVEFDPVREKAFINAITNITFIALTSIFVLFFLLTMLS